jgi:hypothetical protein
VAAAGGRPHAGAGRAGRAVKDDLRSVPTLDELANDSGRTVMLPVEAIEALLARYAGGKPAGLAQDERSGATGRLDLTLCALAQPRQECVPQAPGLKWD